jgi:hypothetical protein
VGLDCRCEHLHDEPRFRLGIDQSRSHPLLYLVLRNDDAIQPQPIHADPDTPGVLFEIAESTVRRDPDMGVWLPHVSRHRHVAWREAGTWRVTALNGAPPIATAAEAVAHARQGQETPG